MSIKKRINKFKIYLIDHNYNTETGEKNIDDKLQARERVRITSNEKKKILICVILCNLKARALALYSRMHWKISISYIYNINFKCMQHCVINL